MDFFSQTSTMIGMAVVLVALGWFDRTPAALVVDRDPLLLNGPGAVRIPARVVTQSGKTLSDASILASAASDSIVVVTDSTVRCLREGDATISLSSGPLHGELHMRCRPIGAFSPFGFLELDVSGPPQPIQVVAYAIDAFPQRSPDLGPIVLFPKSDSRLVEELSFSAHVKDSAVASVDAAGLVHPLAVGTTLVTLDFVGLEHIVSVRVIERLVTDTLHLARGEIRSWELAPGRYRVRVYRADGVEAPAGTEFSTVDANCAREPANREMIHCVVYARDLGKVFVRATRAVGAVVQIDRMPD